MATLEFAGPATRLSPGDIKAVAALLGCGPAVVHAVCDVEAAGRGFLPDSLPKILFEAHLFGRLTAHRWDSSHPHISAPRWNRSLYGPGGRHQYERLWEAIALDRAAALQSASWGMFQVLGSNFRLCGFHGVESFVAAMATGERAHLDAFAAFCRANRLDGYLRSSPPDFARFARGYNGPGYRANAYDTKLAAAWRKWLANPAANENPAPRTVPEEHYRTLQLDSQGEDVGSLQRGLNALGFDVSVDRDFGPETLAAVVAFQKAHRLVPDGVVGPATRTALIVATARALQPAA